MNTIAAITHIYNTIRRLFLCSNVGIWKSLVL